MPKSKRARLHTGHGGGNQKKPRKMHTFSKLSSTISSASSSPKQNVGKKNPLHQRPIIPFGRNDRILLVGEGMVLPLLDFLGICHHFVQTSSVYTSMINDLRR